MTANIKKKIMARELEEGMGIVVDDTIRIVSEIKCFQRYRANWKGYQTAHNDILIRTEDGCEWVCKPTEIFDRDFDIR